MKKKFGANGNINLKSEYWESASGHADSESGAELFALDDNTIVLKTYNNSAQVIGHTYNRKDEKNYKISVENLIQLIIQNGENFELRNL